MTNNGTRNTLLVGTGTGGNVVLTAPQLTVSNGAVIDASTVNDQSGGTITLNLQQLSLLSGGQIGSSAAAAVLPVHPPHRQRPSSPQRQRPHLRGSTKPVWH